MEKKVFCLIEGRCKSVRYKSDSNLSDIETIKQRLLDAAKIDKVLMEMLKDKMMVLQRPDPDRNNKLCDIEDDDISLLYIIDKNEVTVLLIPVKQTVEWSGSIESDINMEPVVEVLYTEPLNEGNDLVTEVQPSKSMVSYKNLFKFRYIVILFSRL